MDNNAGIVERVLYGSSLRTVMTPDDEIPRNRPLHDESFSLPHVIALGEVFFGITHSSMFTVFHKPQLPVSFYYSNLMEIFGSYSPENMFNDPENMLRFQIASKKRYRQHRWVLKDTCSLVWESNGDMGVELLRDAVNSSQRLKAGFLDEEGVWNIHPVALPQINRRDDDFVMKTSYTIYPYMFRDPETMERLIRENIGSGYFENKDEYQNHFKMGVHHPFVAFYHLYPDGTYHSYYDLKRGNTKNRYSKLRIFAEYPIGVMKDKYDELVKCQPDKGRSIS